jgi:hypothetical protein
MNEWVRSLVWMIITDIAEITRRNICPSATLSITSPEATDLGLNAYLLVDRPATKSPWPLRGLECISWDVIKCRRVKLPAFRRTVLTPFSGLNSPSKVNFKKTIYYCLNSLYLKPKYLKFKNELSKNMLIFVSSINRPDALRCGQDNCG